MSAPASSGGFLDPRLGGGGLHGLAAELMVVEREDDEIRLAAGFLDPFQGLGQIIRVHHGVDVKFLASGDRSTEDLHVLGAVLAELLVAIEMSLVALALLGEAQLLAHAHQLVEGLLVNCVIRLEGHAVDAGAADHVGALVGGAIPRTES
jgi:hypothetical protein